MDFLGLMKIKTCPFNCLVCNNVLKVKKADYFVLNLLSVSQMSVREQRPVYNVTYTDVHNILSNQ